MTTPMPPSSPQALADLLAARPGLHDRRVLAAFAAMPRSLFLPGLPAEQVYADDAIPIKRAADGTVVVSSSQPSMMALMLQQLRLKPGMNVLEIGAGTGYNAALLYHLVGSTGRVTTVELDPQVAEEAADHLVRAGASAVRVITGDAASGFAPRASYDRIIATAGVWDIPTAWVRQLKPRGRLVAPVWIEGLQYSAAFDHQPDGTLYSIDNLPCGFVRLRGAALGEEGMYRVGSALSMLANAGAIDAAQVHLFLSQIADPEPVFLASLTPADIALGLSLFIALTVPPQFTFAAWQVADGEQAYGLHGSGIALLGRGSACFLPTHDGGRAVVFGGSDAVVEVEARVMAWLAAGRPDAERLRLRVSPVTAAGGHPPAMLGRHFIRRDHALDTWLEAVSPFTG